MPGLTRPRFIPVPRGEWRSTRCYPSQDVNEYFTPQIAGEDFTAKDFRTWGGTVLAAIALSKQEEFETKKQATSNIKTAICAGRGTSWQHAGGCRKCYVVIGDRGSLPEADAHAGLNGNTKSLAPPNLRAAERAVLKFLHARKA